MAAIADIGVIIPTFNRADLLRYTLNSLAGEKHPGVNIEIIVVDDGSVDDTETVVKTEYPNVIFLRNKGKGAPSARNMGLAATTADYIVYLDSDDLIGEGFLKQKIDFLNHNKQFDACYGDEVLFEGNGEVREGKSLFKHKYPLLKGEGFLKEHLKRLLSGQYIHPSAIVWRSTFLAKIGGHDEKLAINQDVELFFRALFNGLNITAIDDGTFVYTRRHNVDDRVGSVGKSNLKWKQLLALRAEIYQKLQQRGMMDDTFREALSYFLFNNWRSLRHWDRSIANDYLVLTRKVKWPVQLKGNAGFRLLGRLIGPDKAVMLKYFLLRRD